MDLDPRRPVGWLVEREPGEGGGVVPILTILLANRECPWRCVFCDLWKGTLERSVDLGDVPAQVQVALEDPVVATSAVRHIKLYNAGSYFDARAIPPGDDATVAAMVQAFERVIVESHPSLIGDRCWRFRDQLSREGAGGGVGLEVAMGLESSDPEVLAQLNKGMTPDDFADAAETLKREGVGVRAFVLVQPPFVDPRCGVEAAVESVEFALDCGADVVSLIPVRGGSEALEALRAQGRFHVPGLRVVEEAMDRAMEAHRGRGRILVDLWDLDRLRRCGACYERRRERLETMNMTQAPQDRVICPECGGQC